MSPTDRVDVRRLGRDEPEIARSGVGRRRARPGCRRPRSCRWHPETRRPSLAMASRCSRHGSMAQTSCPHFLRSAAYTAPIAPVPTIAIFIAPTRPVRRRSPRGNQQKSKAEMYTGVPGESRSRDLDEVTPASLFSTSRNLRSSTACRLTGVPAECMRPASISPAPHRPRPNPIRNSPSQSRTPPRQRERVLFPEIRELRPHRHCAHVPLRHARQPDPENADRAQPCRRPSRLS